MSEKFYTYKGYPLVRSGKTIYYGNMYDPYVIMIQIMSAKKSESGDVTEKVRVIQMSTDPNINPLEACVRNAERECGLYEALDIANIWLEKAMSR